MSSSRPHEIFALIATHDYDTLKAYVLSGADLSVTNAKGETPAVYAANTDRKCVEIIADNLDKSSGNNGEFKLGSALLTCVLYDDIEVARKLLIAGASKDWTFRDTGNNITHTAVQNKNSEMLAMLLQFEFDVPCTTTNNDGLTPLQLACRRAAWDCAELLVQTNLDELEEFEESWQIDLNNAWNEPENQLRKVTIAWKLAQAQQWDMLLRLGQQYPITLTTQPKIQQQTAETAGKNINIAWLLAHGNKWEMLFEFACKSSIQDHTTLLALLTSKHDNKVLIDEWIDSNEESLMRLLNLCDSNILVSLRMLAPRDSFLFDAASLAYVKIMLVTLSPALLNHAHLSPEDKTTLNINIELMLEKLCDIHSESAFYKDAQQELALIIFNQLLPCATVHQSVTNYLNRRLALVPTFHGTAADGFEASLRMIMLHCATNAGDGQLVSNIYAESLRTVRELREENSKLKESLKRSREEAGLSEPKDRRPTKQANKLEGRLFDQPRERKQPARAAKAAIKF